MRGDFGPEDVAAAIKGGRYSTRMRGPVDQKAKVSGHGHDHDGDRFRWETADTTEGPVLNSLWLVKGIIPRQGIRRCSAGQVAARRSWRRTLVCMSLPVSHGAGTGS